VATEQHGAVLIRHKKSMKNDDERPTGFFNRLGNTFLIFRNSPKRPRLQKSSTIQMLARYPEWLNRGAV